MEVEFQAFSGSNIDGGYSLELNRPRLKLEMTELFVPAASESFSEQSRDLGSVRSRSDQSELR